MALKQDKRTATPPAPTPATPGDTQVAQPVIDDTVLLELAIYTHYTWGGETYAKGTAYRFTRDVAMSLLGELDHGRQVWKLYRAPAPKVAPKAQVIDATEVTATRTRQSIEEVLRGQPHNSGQKRIDVGTDDEIKDILNRPESAVEGAEGGVGNVTV